MKDRAEIISTLADFAVDARNQCFRTYVALHAKDYNEWLATDGGLPVLEMIHEVVVQLSSISTKGSDDGTLKLLRELTPDFMDELRLSPEDADKIIRSHAQLGQRAKGLGNRARALVAFLDRLNGKRK